MNEKKSFEIIAYNDIILRNSPVVDFKFDQGKLEKIWQNICDKKNNKLFNGKVLTYIDSFKQNNKLIINAGFVDYKIVVSSRFEPSLGLKIKQIGVSGITLINDNGDEYVLFSTRSSDVTEYPNFLELVPSGQIDDSTLKSDGTIDFSTKLIDEFTEETGLKKNCIQEIETMCLVIDKKNEVYDICCKIKILNSKSNIIKTFEKVSEYGKPELVYLNSLSDYVSSNYDRIIPTSLAILSHFLKQ